MEITMGMAVYSEFRNGLGTLALFGCGGRYSGIWGKGGSRFRFMLLNRQGICTDSSIPIFHCANSSPILLLRIYILFIYCFVSF